jgi:hypothetical protein
LRERLRTEEIAECLTYSNYLDMHEEEPVILHSCLERNPFYHWIEHLNSLPRVVNDERPTYHVRENFERLKDLIKTTLRNSNFFDQSYEIENCINEEQLNNRIIRQYTETTGLYRKANKLLRDCHRLQNRKSIMDDSQDKFLAPWILQLSSCLRTFSHYQGIAYRGTNLKGNEIQKYKKDKLFIWASFVSASKNPAQCFGGNTFFEITSTNHFFGMHDKAYPRDISGMSAVPREEEVLFPIACAFRVIDIQNLPTYIKIRLETIDYY